MGHSGHAQRPRSVMYLLAAVAFLLWGLGSAGAGELIDQCSLPPELIAPMLEIDPMTSDCSLRDDCARELASMARELVADSIY